MSLRHLTLLLLLSWCSASPVWAIDSSSGPTSESEAEILYQDGRTAFDQKDFQTSVSSLQRFIARYPGKKGYLESHLILGRALLELGRPRDALTPLRYFVEGSKDFEQTASARIFMCIAYLKLHDAHEAYLSAYEIERLSKVTSIDPPLIAEGMLFQAQSLVDLKQDARAMSTLASAKKLTMTLSSSPESHAHASWIDMQLKLKECGKLPSRGALEEDEIRAQLERKGLCLNQATHMYRALLESSSARWLEESTQALKQGYQTYEKNCANPPLPPARIHPKPRTASQLAQYKTELIDRLVQDCETRERPAYGILLDLKQMIPKEAAVDVDQVMQQMSVKSP